MTQISDFIKAWSNKGDEVGNKATYWDTLLRFLGVPQQELDDGTFIDYEKSIKLNSVEHFHGSIDAYIPSTRVLIEQKSFGVDLFKPENRPNGSHTEKITPYEQARRYDNNLPNNEKARYLVLCNFSQIVVYDVRTSLDVKPYIIELKDLDHDLSRLNFLVDISQNQHLEKEKRVSLAAGELVGKIYTELLKIYAQYGDINEDKITKSINALCVRLVFCLYAEDAGLFNDHEQFYDYLKDVKPNKIGVALRELFKVLDTKDRTKDDPFFEDENPELAAFPYVNGGLFHDENIIIPPFTPELKHILLDEASQKFDWSDISPTIFGAVFESTLNPDTRRQGGMHYTSVENIHKVVDPLFLNDLKADLQAIKDKYDQKTALTKWQKKALAKDTLEFQDKLSKLTFLDPACGSGNFLTETYLSLRKLENEAIRMRTMGESILDMGDKDIIQVSIQQFFGIEINDFAVSVAKTALWIAEDQMMKETQDLIAGAEWDFLPLQSYNHIHEGNALKIDWNEIIPNYACHYVIGNPPFVGLTGLQKTNKELQKEQKSEMDTIFKGVSKHGKLDYVAGWYGKAVKYIDGTDIQVAFVSTNSITQGEQVAILWPYVLDKYHCKIIFAYHSFLWSSESKSTASVFCVIIGFTQAKYKKPLLLFDNGRSKVAKHINGYLLDADDLYIKGRVGQPSLDMPKMTQGSKALDGGNLILNQKQYDEFIAKYPQLSMLIRPYMGAGDMISGKKRYCFWLKNINPELYRHNREIKQRLDGVVAKRKASPTEKISREAEYTPYLFTEIRQPNADYIAVPKTSTNDRKYIPIDIVPEKVIATTELFTITPAELWIFSVLNSSLHMQWTNMVCGRLGNGFRYSPAIYANFPWRKFSQEQKDIFAKNAQSILDARKNHPDVSLEAMYNKYTMPPDLIKAHLNNDKAVLKAYDLATNVNEYDMTLFLLDEYKKLAKD